MRPGYCTTQSFLASLQGYPARPSTGRTAPNTDKSGRNRAFTPSRTAPTFDQHRQGRIRITGSPEPKPKDSRVTRHLVTPMVASVAACPANPHFAKVSHEAIGFLGNPTRRVVSGDPGRLKSKSCGPEL